MTLFSRFSSDTNIFGLDIGTSGIRVVQAVPGKNAPKLKTYASMPIEAKLAMSDSPSDRKQLVEAIRKIVDNSNVDTNNVVVGLPSQSTFASLIDLPKMPENELEQSIQYQADQYIPMQADKAKIDWLVTGNLVEENKQEVLLVATAQDITEKYLAMLEEAGLDVVAIEPDAFGLARSLVSDPNAGVVILDLGANNTDLVTVYEGIPRLIRSIPVGGETLIKSAANNLGIEEDQASQFVYKFGLTQDKLEGQVYRSIKTNIDTLLSELNKSNTFFHSRYKDVELEKIIVTGGASLLPQLPNYIANNSGLPVEIGNSWNKMSYSLTMQDQLLSVSNQFAVACGLSLRGVL